MFSVFIILFRLIFISSFLYNPIFSKTYSLENDLDSFDDASDQISLKEKDSLPISSLGKSIAIFPTLFEKNSEDFGSKRRKRQASVTGGVGDEKDYEDSLELGDRAYVRGKQTETASGKPLHGSVTLRPLISSRTGCARSVNCRVTRRPRIKRKSTSVQLATKRPTIFAKNDCPPGVDCKGSKQNRKHNQKG